MRVVSVPGPSRLTAEGDKLADVPTVTKEDAALRPADVALIVAVPTAIPLRTTERLGVV